MVLMTGRVGVGERQRGRPQPRVVLKCSLWGHEGKKKQHKIHQRQFKNISQDVEALFLRHCCIFGHV